MLSIDLLRPDRMPPDMYAELESWITNFQHELETQSESLTEPEIRKMFLRAWPYLTGPYLHQIIADWSFLLKIESNAYWSWIDIFIKRVDKLSASRIGVLWVDVANCRLTIKNQASKKESNLMEYLEV